MLVCDEADVEVGVIVDEVLRTAWVTRSLRPRLHPCTTTDSPSAASISAMPGARLCSDVVLSVISGVLLRRRVVGARAMNRRNAPEQLATLLAAVLDAIVETPVIYPC
ncbi:hypothetical protein AWC12_12325 [Mycolicibacterium iranicum]|uniref:Uncharacterized protein n=2 Tax=Mycolicibacterium iranicum TaxID=912594 RepID=A0A1X1WQ77_MYCIR|nr:hypothetical protein AWC12_12325 [Mycolicibacterium iranicum]